MGSLDILIVEDDPEIGELLSYSLSREGWTARLAPDGECGLKLFRERKPDCVILDIMLPGIGGLDVLRKIRAKEEGQACPVILATARGEEPDIIVGLELGADDYIVKPFSTKVLAARIRAVTRRAISSEGEAQADDRQNRAVISIAGLTLDQDMHTVVGSGGSLDLTATEFCLLELLMRNPGRVFTRSKILELIKGSDYPVTDRAVDVQILSLRKKLGPDSERVETVRGVGYRFGTP